MYLAAVFGQAGFLGHEAGHRQIFRSRRGNGLVGLVYGNLLIGLSFGWWTGKHNRHHAYPNQEGKDPDITIPALAFTPGQARGRGEQPGCWPGTRPTCSSPCCCSRR